MIVWMYVFGPEFMNFTNCQLIAFHSSSGNPFASIRRLLDLGSHREADGA
jgi:hypothetical protein